MCMEETACKKCGWKFHPLETPVCINQKCKEEKLDHPLYCRPKECKNQNCLFFELAQRAEKSSKKVDLETGDCFTQ